MKKAQSLTLYYQLNKEVNEMANTKEWIKNIKMLKQEDIEKYMKALEVLADWKFFRQEYGWTGLKQVWFFLEGQKKGE